MVGPVEGLTRKLSVGLAVLLIPTFGPDMSFSLKTHREFSGSAEHAEEGEGTTRLQLTMANKMANKP